MMLDRSSDLTNPNIREANLSDLDSIIDINMKCLPEHYPRYFWEYHLNKWRDIFLVAEYSNILIGYMMNRIENDEGFFLGNIVTRGHVVSIAVLQEYRRRGVGRALMLEGMRRMKTLYNALEVVLEVRVSNKPAINLYKNLGFKIVKIIPRYYIDGEDAYLMAKPL